MRVLCLNLKTPQEPSLLDAFVVLSPQVQFRYPCYVFINITSTLHLLGGEQKCLNKALEIAKYFSSTTTAAIADSPALAQMFSKWRPSYIQDQKDKHIYKNLGLDAIKDLEGLKAWEKNSVVEHIISVCHSLGFHSLEEIFQLQLSSLRERWGNYGTTLWNRLHFQDIQVISPHHPSSPFVGYSYLEHPVGDCKSLAQYLNQQLTPLFLRLEGLSRYCQKMTITLYCEYSDKNYSLPIEPISPSRDQKLLEDLLVKKLEKLNLENPIKEFEIQIYDTPEKVQQLNFFEPRDLKEDKWKRLISFMQQAECKIGFLEMQPSTYPEDSYQFVSDWPEKFIPKDEVLTKDEAVMIKTHYSKLVNQSPRPSLLLSEPLLLNSYDSNKLQFLTQFPIERIESEWWKTNSQKIKNRDYFFAYSPQGQLLWVFKDRTNSQVYIHGYFD